MRRERVKYPRTYHLPFSPGVTRDDLVLPDTKHFADQEIVVTTKMDGENTTMYPDYMHARSIDGMSHPSQSWVKNLHAGIRHMIPPGHRICGENMYAEHSIRYEDLTTYFYGFSVWRGRVCLSWDDSLQIFETIGIEPVPVVYEGLWHERFIQSLGEGLDKDVEGFVVRIRGAFLRDEFDKYVSKFVRKHHVRTDYHWKKNWKRNRLRR